MRKGQIKILDRVNYNIELTPNRYYPKACLRELSREDLTIAQLHELEYEFQICWDKSEEWAELFINIYNRDYRYIVRYIDQHDREVSLEILKLLRDDQIFEFLKSENIICNDNIDLALALYFYDDGNYVINYLISKIREMREIESDIMQTDDPLMLHDYINWLNIAYDIYDVFKNSIDFDHMIKNVDPCNFFDGRGFNLYDLNKDVQIVSDTLLPFHMKSAYNIPEHIKNIDFGGYAGVFNISGRLRLVSSTNAAMFMKYCDYNTVSVSRYGNLYAKPIMKKSKNLVFDFKTRSFTIGYMCRSDNYKYRPVELRELFDIISITDDDEDIKNAQDVINFLCERYNTFIFKDLYADYQKSGGLLLPILITEAAEFKTKQELLYKFYKFDMQGNWNKKNINLAYVLSKIKSKMTDAALARAMQIQNIKYLKIGRYRYLLAAILYNAIYNAGIQGDHIHADNQSNLLRDALQEEYDMNQIALDPINITINRHNRRVADDFTIEQHKKIKFKIKKDTKFKKLIDNMPPEYELITTPARLIQETQMQHNCVARSTYYSDRIARDNCMIYSVVKNDIRHTVEIIMINNNYKVVQCLKACNKAPLPELQKELRDIVNNINKKHD